MKEKVAFTVLATGKYKELLPQYFEGISFACSVVIVATDDEEIVKSYPSYGLKVITHHITHLPIPLIYTISPVLVLEALTSKLPKEIEYVYIIQSNCTPLRNFANVVCLKGKIITCLNGNWSRDSKAEDFVSTDGLTHSTYIQSDYQYVWGSLFGGDVNILIPALRCMVRWLEKDLLSNKIPYWHQEAYFNKWNYINPHRSIKLEHWKYFYLFPKPQVDKSHVISQLWKE